MRLQDEEQPSEHSSFASGGLLPGGDGSDTILAHIGSPERVLTPEEMRTLFWSGYSEWDPWALPETVHDLQESEMTTLAHVRAGFGYANKSTRNREYRLSVAIQRDNRLNTEEQDEYNRTRALLEFGPSFYRRAHP